MLSNEMHWKQYHKWSHLDRTEKCNVLTWNLNEEYFWHFYDGFIHICVSKIRIKIQGDGQPLIKIN